MNRNETVLVISDGHSQFDTAAERLRTDGYDVRFERDMSESLKVAQARPPQLIISELAVPDIDGLKLCSRMRGADELGSTPILLVGDLSQDSPIVADAMQCGATNYLQKPFDDLELLDVCRQMISLEEKDTSPHRDESLFNTLIENIADAITIIDPAGTILFASPSAKSILGHDPHELLGKDLFDLAHPADVPEVFEYFNYVDLNGDKSPTLDFRLRQSDGSWKLIESTGRPIDDPKFGSAVVVTSREMYQTTVGLAQALANENFRAAIFNNSQSGLAFFSSSGRLIENNPALGRMFENAEPELLGMLLTEFLYTKDLEGDKAAIAEVISGERPGHRMENGYLAPSGERVWGALTVIGIPGTGKNGHFLLGIFDDPLPGSHSCVSLKKESGEFLIQCDDPRVLEFTRWKIDKGLVCEN